MQTDILKIKTTHCVPNGWSSEKQKEETIPSSSSGSIDNQNVWNEGYVLDRQNELNHQIEEDGHNETAGQNEADTETPIGK